MPTHTQRIYVHATPEEVWDGLTSPEQIAKYGYGGAVECDWRPGSPYVAKATPEMLQFGAPEVMVDGRVLEADAPKRLVHTWRLNYEGPGDEPHSTVTYELEAGRAGVTKLTTTFDAPDDAPISYGITSGAIADAGGGFPLVLSDLKTLLETGSPLPSQLGMPGE
ncbi:MAG TPA: SRPBCC domain-containing protein [Gaiellaceae bacterium]|nr:SRPBCC domain-containing protein [Gaiellaceae bacterium]